MEFDIRVAHRVEEIGQENWERSSFGRPFSSYGWYQFGERVRANDRPLYILLYLHGEPVARASFWASYEEPLPMSSKAIGSLLQRFFRYRPLLICRTPVADASGLILPTDPELRAAAIQTISTVVRAEAARLQTSFIVYFYLEKEETQFSGWPASYDGVELPGPGTRLQITWPDFESYVNGLSKPVLRAFRHNNNRAEAMDIQIKGQPQVTNPELALRLISAVEAHHHNAPNKFIPAILQYANMVDATWVTGEYLGQMAGCLILFRDRDCSFVTLLGLDYHVKYVYFQLLYEAIRRAICPGTTSLWAGTGAYEIKQELGFELTTNNYIMYTSQIPGLQKAAHFLTKWVN